MRLFATVFALNCALTTTTDCTSSESSPEHHAYASVTRRSDSVGGNFTVNHRENYRLNLPAFAAVYVRGQQGKVAGMSESDTRRITEVIKQQAAQGTRTRHAFAGNTSDKWGSAMENRDAVLFGNELSGVYLGGYLEVE